MCLTNDQRIFIVDKRHDGLGYRRIKNAFEEQFGSSITVSTVKKWCCRFEDTGNLDNKKRNRMCQFGTDEHLQYLENCINSKPDSTAKELSDKLLTEFNIQVSNKRINILRKKLGWTQVGTQYCQLIRDVNKVKRKDWCTKMMNDNETFDVSLSIYIHLITIICGV